VLAIPNCPHRGEKAAWQFVYRNVLRMEKRGLLRRSTGSQGNKSRYQLAGSGEAATSVPSKQQQVAENSITTGAEDSTIRCLQEKLHHYKVEMLSAIGETEEYDAICTELPHMRNVVQALYNEARDRCSKILGRVRALESILSNQWQQSS